MVFGCCDLRLPLNEFAELRYGLRSGSITCEELIGMSCRASRVFLELKGLWIGLWIESQDDTLGAGDEEFNGMIMPFGKHRGKAIADLDGGYLRWCCENLTSAGPKLRAALEKEWERRNGTIESSTSTLRIPEASIELWHELIEAGYKQLALRYHPDRGGDPDTMIRLNVLRDVGRRLR
jgi:hypothetical protein